MNLFLDVVGGISGDMMMATLLGLGADFEEYQRRMKTLPMGDEFEIALTQERKGSIAGLKINIIQDLGTRNTEHLHHRGLWDIYSIIEKSELSIRAKHLSKKVFRILGEAEAAVHGTTIEQVHFHEVGAVDSIVDILGVCTLIDMLGIQNIYYNSLPLGSGRVDTDHGLMPVPAPATLRLMETLRCRASEEKGEQVTPTGAALLRGLEAKTLPLMEMDILKTSIGCGTKNFKVPNILRGILFQNAEGNGQEELMMMECNLDDMTGELMAHAAEKLMEAGSLDVWLTPIIMKKGRPAYTLKALLKPEMRDAIREVFFRETSTLGVRQYKVQRAALKRDSIQYEMSGEPLPVKRSYLYGQVIKEKPEFENLKKISDKTGIALQKLDYKKLKEINQEKINQEKIKQDNIKQEKIKQPEGGQGHEGHI